MKFKLEIDLENKNMNSHIHVAKALRDLSDQFNYSCEHFPNGAIMDTKNEEVVGWYGVILK
jgi:hypothetical protein